MTYAIAFGLVAGVCFGATQAPVAAAGSHGSQVSQVSHGIAPPYAAVSGELEFSGELIVRPKQGLDNSQRAVALGLIANQVLRHHLETDEFILAVGLSPERIGSAENRSAQGLMSTGLFQYAHPNWIVYPVAIPNDPRLSEQWHHAMMKSPEAWNISSGSPSVVVAVTDTGIVPHEDLTHRVGGYNAVSHVAEIDGGDMTDVHGHGTHVAGCAAATGENGVGVAGVGWSLSVMPIRVSEAPNGGASFDALLEGQRWAAEHGAKVISASYSGIGYDAIETTGAYIHSLNASLLWAAGNSSTDHAGWDFGNVLVVGASDQNDQRAWFSSYGLGVDLFAPGVAILSTTADGSYQAWSGTSMATPVANGALGVVRSVNPALSAIHAEYILLHACDPWGGASNTVEWGFGRINLKAAAEQAIAAMTPQPPVARDDIARYFVGESFDIDALNNDYDAYMDALVIDWAAPLSSMGDPIVVVAGAGPAGRDVVRMTSLSTATPGRRTIAYRLREPISGAVSQATITATLAALREPTSPVGETPGMSCSYYALTDGSALPNWSTLTPYQQEIVTPIYFPSTDGNFAGSGRADFVGAVYDGWLKVPASGIWTLSISSDDGSRLSIGTEVVIENDGLHGMLTKSAQLAFTAGMYPIHLEFFENGGGAGLTFAWSGPGVSSQIIPSEFLWHGGAVSLADINQDGRVDAVDLTTLLSAWGSSNAASDINHDGVVNAADLALVIAAWGE